MPLTCWKNEHTVRIALAIALMSLGGCSVDASDAEPDIGANEEATCSISVDPTRSLFVTDATALSHFGFQRVLKQIVTRAGTGQTALSLYQQWWDTNNDAAHAKTSGPHCDANGGTINGFPIDCPRQEGILAGTNPFLGGSDGYTPIGIVNRFDLAPGNGANCGEYRIVFGKNSGLTSPFDRNLVIFEAVMPNPTPASGLAGCLAVAQFWADLSLDTSASSRASKLDTFYFSGIPGFPPVVDATHYGSGGGQIRANQFMNVVSGQQWQLREYKLATVCGASCVLQMQDVTVKNNPFGALFSASGPPLSAQFQVDFLNQVQKLAARNLNTIGMRTKSVYNAGQSSEQDTTNDYAFQLNGDASFISAIDSKLAAIGRTDLTAQDIANRATTQACAGCHEISNGRSLGAGLTWPASNGFTQIDEASRLSPALTTVFLPHRKHVLESFLCSNLSAPQTADPIGGGSGI